MVNETSENVWFDQFRIMSTGPLIVQETHYDPWGVELSGLGYQYGGIKVNPYLYNGKEANGHLGVNLFDYGARMYDPAIGRWFVVDPLAEIAYDKTTYHYVSNNPINRIDPNGLTDFKLNKETGEINQVGDPKDDVDRIVKTDKNGNVKIKGEGFLGFLVKDSERGKEKVAIDNISKGILEDGLNLKENNHDFEVNGEGQPSLNDVNKFISQFSDYVGKEIAGVRLGQANSSEVTKVRTYKYISSTRTTSETPLKWFSQFGDYLKGHFHTHPHNDHRPSESNDIPLRNRYPNLPFFILAGGNEKKF